VGNELQSPVKMFCAGHLPLYPQNSISFPSFFSWNHKALDGGGGSSYTSLPWLGILRNDGGWR
jgi:hypothetical protein